MSDELHGQLDTGYPHTLRPELHKALKARGIDYWVAQGITFWNRDDGCECLAYGYQADGVPKLAVKVVGLTDPEQAIAATSPRDEGESYDAGFTYGVKATLQQLYGLLHEYPTLDEIEAWADSQWEVPE